MRYILFVMLFVVMGAVSCGGQTSELITYQVDGESYEGYYVDAGKNAPFILLMHDWDGMTEYEKKRSDMLGELGFSVFALDLFGSGIRPVEVEDRRKHTGELYKDREKMRNLMYAALEEAKKEGANIDNGVAMGYCFGGVAVLELARTGANLKGFVSFHGGLLSPVDQDYSKTKGEVLVFHGSSDKVIVIEQFMQLAIELEEAKVPHEMIIYGGAKHAFTVFGGEKYDKSADTKSWAKFLEFLDTKLK